MLVSKVCANSKEKRLWNYTAS